LILYSSSYLMELLNLEFMVLSDLVDIFVCLLYEGDVSELEHRVEQWCWFSKSRGKTMECFFLQSV
jgi:hypothetical protein